MSSCLSGGGRTYGFDLEIVKSQSPSKTRTSHSSSSSPSSTFSESINSPLAISTRKSRTPRKRPNQTYNEAAALLSTVYPNIFSTKHLISQQQQQRQPLKHTTKVHDTFAEEFAELLPPSPAFDNTEFLINHHKIPEKPSFEFAPKILNSGENPCQFAATDYDFPYKEDRFEEDFDAESILDEEMEAGIDSIMGNLSVKNNNSFDGSNAQPPNYNWNPMGLGFNGSLDFGFGICRGVRAFRRVDDSDWWRFPTVDVLAISPKLNKASASSSEKNNNNKKKKKKIETGETGEEEQRISSGPCKENSNWNPATNAAGLGLKLNYEDVLSAWSDRGLPFSEEFPGIDSDAIARLAQIDLFSENGGIREASVLRYREKRRSRLFSKKIRYQVRKVNADRRPRMKARSIC